ILTTRERPEFRRELLDIGFSQMSAGSSVGVGGYAKRNKVDERGLEEKPQFNLADHRKPIEVIKDLVRNGYIPSYCTACYREGRTGDRFMPLAKSGQIANFCLPNALLTFEEYLADYADEELKEMGQNLIDEEIRNIPSEAQRAKALEYLRRIRQGERDLRF
ncbi:MAG: [FeFe] hydrogenase H-cluster radical SAM maturase HydG, partial [Clostridia bacterium]|nr:[FeFe] hydrogenase H-cluster radical SAM maturase HydG [Clostridia bacterium]